MLYVWDIYFQLPYIYSKCRQTYSSPMEHLGFTWPAKPSHVTSHYCRGITLPMPVAWPMPYRKMWSSPWAQPWLKDDWNPFPTGKMSPWASWCESLPDGDVVGVYGQHPKLPDGGFGR